MIPSSNPTNPCPFLRIFPQELLKPKKSNKAAIADTNHLMRPTMLQQMGVGRASGVKVNKVDKRGVAEGQATREGNQSVNNNLALPGAMLHTSVHSRYGSLCKT